MKKTILFLVAVMALVTVGCKRTPKGSSAKEADIVIIDHGQMAFYDLETKKLTPFEKETDSVINLLFDDNNHLYYTVSKNQNLSLKMIDMNEASPDPKKCADWNMTLMNSLDEMSGKPSGMFWDKNNENIITYKTDYEEFTFTTLLYNVKTGKVRAAAEDEEDLYYYDFSKDFDQDHYYYEGEKFYHVTPEGKFCLTDQLHFDDVFDEDELDGLEFISESLSPDGQRMLFEACVIWGDGWGHYCVSTIDGTSQTLFDDSDIWDLTPKWLPDGSLVYVGQAPRPKDDPEYEEDWNTTQPCIKIVDPQMNATTISLGEIFAIKPCGETKKNDIQQGNLEGCDVALLDNGKVTFYNSTTGEFVPFVAETDSVINGVFIYGSDFYYTVVIGDELYLKEIYMSEYSSQPSMRTDWDLQLYDCVSETYGKASPLAWIPAYDRIGIYYNFSWDYYNFADIRFYSLYENVKLDGWSEDELESDVYDEKYLQLYEDMESFSTANNNYYYTTGTGEACISDQIDFKQYASDPDYYEDPEFALLSIDPTRKSAVYVALIEWGDLGHGPLCYATLDGKVQLAFDDADAADLSYGWLKDGSLLYVGAEPRPATDPEYNEDWNTTRPCIKIVKPDGTVEVFSHATDFVVSDSDW